MTLFLARRAGLALLTLFLVSVVVFATAQVLPGDVGRTILGPFASNAEVARVDHQLGANGPVVSRYIHWLGQFLQGDWGSSYTLNVPVRSLALGRLGNSAILGLFSLVLAVPLAVGSGVVAALRRDTWADRSISIAGVVLIAFPEFVTGVVLIVIFAVALNWFPATSHPPSASVVDFFRQLLLPAIPLVCAEYGYISRMARSGTLEALDSNFVRTARLKGLTRRQVIWRHVLPNGLLPTITVVGVQAGYLVGGLVVVETLFDYPGIGRLIYESATGHDLPVLESGVLVTAFLFVFFNLITDLVYGVLNPRIRLS